VRKEDLPEDSWFRRYRSKRLELTPEEKEIVRRRVEEAKRRTYEQLRERDGS
jgi:hypothetical protein